MIANSTFAVCAEILVFVYVLRKVHQWRVLSHYPGPFLAGWTRFYRAYYDIVVGGGWIEHLEDLHEIYGPVVRVAPNELHFAEPTAYADIYSSTPAHPKDPYMYNTFDIPPSSFSQTDPKEHTALKSLTSSFFSRRSILSVEHILQEQVDKLLSRLVTNHKYEPADMDKAFRSTTLDMITIYTFAYTIDAISYPKFEHPVLMCIDKHVKNIWVFKPFPLIKQIMVNLPRWLAVLIAPSARHSIDFTAEMEQVVDIALAEPSRPVLPEDRNVFYTLLNEDQGERRRKQGHRMTRRWLIGEGQVLRVAGSDTVGNTCTIGARCILRDEAVLGKLKGELEEAWPSKDCPMSYERLEKLPYLTAVVKESLRVASGLVTPLARVVPPTGSIIAGHSIPPGTVVASGNSFVHGNPDIFPNPMRFDPERWMGDDSHSLDKYLVAFGKGPRSCIGINLAWCELYLLFGNVFRKLNLQPTHDLSSKLRVMDHLVPFYDGEVLHVTATERER